MAERLKRRSEYLKTFASGVSHEFKTPLSAIKGALELIAEHGSTMAPDVLKRFQGNILEDLNRLERLVARLLTLAKSDAQILPTGEARTDANLLFTNMRDRLERFDEDFEVIISDLPQDLFLAVEKDALETVLINLIENSRESGAHKVVITARISDKYGILEVEDDGKGIDPNDAEKIFAPFYTTRKSSGGTGLGLSLARTLLAPYQGELKWLRPPATFEIKIPLFRQPN
jgi:signal transduction histidine kinase